MTTKMSYANTPPSKIVCIQGTIAKILYIVVTLYCCPLIKLLIFSNFPPLLPFTIRNAATAAKSTRNPTIPRT